MMYSTLLLCRLGGGVGYCEDPCEHGPHWPLNCQTSFVLLGFPVDDEDAIHLRTESSFSCLFGTLSLNCIKQSEIQRIHRTEPLHLPAEDLNWSEGKRSLDPKSALRNRWFDTNSWEAAVRLYMSAGSPAPRSRDEIDATLPKTSFVTLD